MINQEKLAEIVGNERSRRKKVLKKAFVTFPHQASRVGCTLRNISETGALIQFAQETIIPDQLTLHVELDGYKIDCRRVRQMRDKVAVEFTGQKEDIGVERQQVVRSATDPLTILKEKEKELKKIIANQRMHQYREPEPEQQEPETRPKAGGVSFGKR